MLVREAEKKVLFQGQATKKNNLCCSIYFWQKKAPLATKLGGGGGNKALVSGPLKDLLFCGFPYIDY